MSAWNREEASLQSEEAYADTSPGLWESLSLDPDEGPELSGDPLVQAVDHVQQLLGESLQALLGGGWDTMTSFVEELPDRARLPLDSVGDADVVPI